MTDIPPSEEPSTPADVDDQGRLLSPETGSEQEVDALGDPGAIDPAAPAETYSSEQLLEAASSEPDFGEPDGVDPEFTGPEFSESDGVDPEFTEPEFSESDRVDPEFTEPNFGAPTPDPAEPTPGSADPAAATPPPLQPPPPTGPPPGPNAVPGPGYPVGGPPPVRRIYRSRHDRKLGGVSAGIAEYFAIDPTIVRLATLAFMISGVGLLVYAAAWIIVPLRPEGAPYHNPPHRVASEKTMTLAFGLAALALAFGIVTGSWEVLAVALIGGGIWLLSEHTAVSAPLAGAAGAPGFQPGSATGATGPATTAFSTTDTTTEGPYPTSAAGQAAFTPPAYPPPTYSQPAYAPPTYAAAPPKERKPQRVTWIVLSLLALLAAVGIAAATGDWWNVSATRFLGIAVIIIGIGVVVGQLRNGGARGLIPLGILAALALFPVSAVDGLIDDGIGQNTYRPLTLEALEDTYQHGIGKLTVDLSRLDFSSRSETIDIDLGIGELIVIVPDEAGGQAVLQAKAGEISHRMPNTDSFLFEDGVNIETGTVRLEGADGTLDLNISVGLGTAELQSVPSR